MPLLSAFASGYPIYRPIRNLNKSFSTKKYAVLFEVIQKVEQEALTIMPK